ncbi:hypothetical protein HYV72_02465 [Candidatus Uhrbacteria bacterium]|nr:hypothetical protein [Candidatus Uhrbacteria bacterium]
MTTQNTRERFGIEQLFGSKTRSRLMQLFLKDPSKQYFVRELTRKIDAQLNSVRREVANLMELGLLEEKEGTVQEDGKTDRRKYYSVNTQFPVFEELRGLFFKANAMMQQELVRSLVDEQPIQVLVLTGSFVGNHDIETDMLIVGSPETKALKARVEQFEAALGYELNYTVMPTEEYLYRKEISDRFLNEILQKEHIELHNSLS